MIKNNENRQVNEIADFITQILRYLRMKFQ